MKKLFLIISILSAGTACRAQTFRAELSGNPLNTSGWTFANGISYVSGNTFVLTDALGSRSGYIYYSTPENLTTCAEFTVEFEFQITNSSSPPADGLAFWYIANPPTGFLLGSGIGLPDNPNGMLLVLDTYNNKGVDNNPVITLRGYDGSRNYDEGSDFGLIGSQLTHQAWVTNQQWHSCTLTYRTGAVNVFFNGSATPAITANYPLNQTGYFGFSASTGSSWSRHSIRNVRIEGYDLPRPPAVISPVVYCQDEPALPLTAVGNNLSWYSTSTGGTALPAAPVPDTRIPGTYTWYVAQAGTAGCDGLRDSIRVIVREPPQPPVMDWVRDYCVNDAVVPIAAAGRQLRWYDGPSGGTGSDTPPVFSTAAPGRYGWYVSLVEEGCESRGRTPVDITVHPGVTASFDTEVRYGCTADTVRFTNTSAGYQTWSWDFGDGSRSSERSPVHVYPVPGVYTAWLTAGTEQCRDTAFAELQLDHDIRAAFLASADTLCTHEVVRFTNQSRVSVRNGIAPVFEWDFGDGSRSALENPEHRYSAPGIYRVQLVVTDFVPCSDTALLTVYVDSPASVWITPGDSVICEGEGIRFQATYPESGIRETVWEFGDYEVRNRNPVFYPFDRSGRQDIRFTAVYRACPDADATAGIQVTPLPVVNIGRDTAICPDGEPVYISDLENAANPLAAWHWSTGETGPGILASAPGTYWTTVQIDGCSNTDSMDLRKDCYLDVPNVFTPNGDGMNDYFFPRNLMGRGISAFNLSVFNRWGQLVFRTDRTDGRGWDGTFNGSAQPQGVFIYLIDVSFHNGHRDQYQGNVTLVR